MLVEARPLEKLDRVTAASCLDDETFYFYSSSSPVFIRMADLVSRVDGLQFLSV